MKRAYCTLVFLLTIFVVLACAARTPQTQERSLRAEENAVIERPQGRISLLTDDGIKSLPIDTRYVVIYFFTPNDKGFSRSELVKMFKALNKSKYVAQGEVTVFMSTDTTLSALKTFLGSIFTELKIEPVAFSEKVKLSIFYDQKKAFAAFRRAGFIVPATLIAEFNYEEQRVRQLYREQDGKPVPWEDFDQLLQGREIVMK